MSAPYPFDMELRFIHRAQCDTKGKTGCIFDHMKEDLDGLPSLIQESSGGHIGTLLETFFKTMEEW